MNFFCSSPRVWLTTRGPHQSHRIHPNKKVFVRGWPFDFWGEQCLVVPEGQNGVKAGARLVMNHTNFSLGRQTPVHRRTWCTLRSHTRCSCTHCPNPRWVALPLVSTEQTHAAAAGAYNSCSCFVFSFSLGTGGRRCSTCTRSCSTCTRS